MKDFIEKYEKRRSKSVEVSIGFTQGYICAVCVLIKFYDEVTTEVLELWGGCKISIKDFDRYNIDEYDREILLKHKKALNLK
jgi:predicted  nucleic acid-binding Zn-ribbon protein